MNETNITKNVLKKNLQKKIEWDVNVPDFKNDVIKILSQNTDGYITDYTFKENSLTLKVDVTANMLYIPDLKDDENAQMACIESTESFSWKIDLPNDISWNMEDIELTVTPDTPILINSRKIGIRANGNICLKLLKNEVIPECVYDAQNTQVLTSIVNANHTVAMIVQKIPISPSLCIPAGKPSIKEILRCKISVTNKELKPLTNKAVLKGNLEVKVLYISQIMTVETAEFVSPFTEIADVANLKEDMDIFYTTRVTKTTAEIFKNEENEQRNINLNGLIELKLTADECVKKDIISDGYSPQYECKCLNETLNYFNASKCLSDSCNVKEIIYFEDCEISQIIDITSNVYIKEAKINENSVSISALLAMEVIYLTANATRCDKKTVNFDFSQDGFNDFNYDNANINADILNFSYAICGHNSIEIRANVIFNTCLTKEAQSPYVIQIDVDKTKKREINKAPIVAYFTKPTDAIFTIAKKYGTTVDKLCEINQIPNDHIFKEKECIIIE